MIYRVARVAVLNLEVPTMITEWTVNIISVFVSKIKCLMLKRVCLSPLVMPSFFLIQQFNKGMVFEYLLLYTPPLATKSTRPP